MPYFLDFIGEKPSFPHVNAKLFGDEADDVWREDLHVGLHTHRLQFLLKGLAPAHQRLCGDARTVSQLLFRHWNGVTLAVTQPNGYRVVPYRVGTTAYSVMFDIFLNIASLKKLTHFLKPLTYLFKEKITSKSDFSCSIQQNIVILLQKMNLSSFRVYALVKSN